MMKSERGGAQTTGTVKRIKDATRKQTNETNSNALRFNAERSERLELDACMTTRAAAAAPHA